MPKAIILILILFCFGQSLIGQANCSVNAGSPEKYCEGEKIKLRGAISGQFNNNTLKWELISAPPGANVIIEDPFVLNTSTNQLNIPGEYQFQISIECENGMASQTVTHILHPSGRGKLIFPDLICHQSFQRFYVVKDIDPGNFFVYDFEIDGFLKIINQGPDSMLVEIRGCWTEEYYHPKYRVTNQFGCSILKQDTMQTTLLYPPEIQFLPPTTSECGNLLGYCPSVGAPQWTIEEQPIGGNASLSTPNAQNTEICDYIVGGNYIITYSVTGIDCIESTISVPIIPEEIDCNPLGKVEYQYCPNTIPSTLLLELKAGFNEEIEEIFWTQTEGPLVEMIGEEQPDLTVNGLISNTLYIFTVELYNPITDCRRTQEYHVFEIALDPDIDFVIRDASFQFCSTFQSCNNQYIFKDQNPNQYFNTDLQVELLSYPPNADLSQVFYMNFYNQSVGDTPMAFFDQKRINNFHFNRLVLSEAENGRLSFYLCSDVVPGNYSFRITLSNDCFFHEQDIVLSTISGFNKVLPNAGTDQVLPCGLNSTTVVGNELGFDDILVYGFWTSIEFPEGSSNPLPSIIQDQFLELSDLVVGKYIFRYYYYYNDLASNQNICEYENRFDDVVVIVSEDEIIGINEIPDHIFCLEEEYCIQLPIDDGGSSSSLIQTDGPTIQIPIFESGGIACFNNLEGNTTYSFDYIVNNGCTEKDQSFTIQIEDAIISPAIILNQDTCVTGSIDDTHQLNAQSLQHGQGEWTYIGSGQAIFDPSPFDPNPTVTIVNGESYPVYREFIWTVTNGICENISEDKLIIRNTGFVPIVLDDLIIDCNADFPYTLELNPSPAPEGVMVSWELLSSNSLDPPVIEYPSNDSTSITFTTAGSFNFELQYIFDGDCGEENEIKQLEVRLSTSDAFAYAGLDIIQCESEFSISALNPEPNEGFWAIEESIPPGLMINIEDSQSYETQISFGQEGTAILSWNILADAPSCGVVAQDDLELSWIEFDLISSDTAICNASTVILAHTPIFNQNIQWTILDGPSSDVFIGPLNSTTTLFSNLVEGVYIFQFNYFTSNSNCNSSGNIQITVFGATDIVSQQTFCELDNNTIDDLQLDFNLAEFQIDALSILNQPIGSAIGIEPSINTDGISFSYTGFDVPGLYTFQIIGESASCSVDANLEVTIGSALSVEPFVNLEYCIGETIHIETGTNPNYFYNWSPAELFDDPTSSNPVFLGTESTNVQVLISTDENFEQCVTEQIININFLQIEASITEPIVLCEFEEVILEVFSSEDDLGITWSNEFGETLGNNNPITILPTGDMLVSALIENPSGCSIELNTAIEISPLLNGISASSQYSEIDLGQSTTLNVELNDGSIENCTINWSSSQFLNDSNIQNPIASPIETTIFEVSIEKDGCSAFDTIEVEVDDSCLLKEYYIPNTFTPNGDGHNDCFQIYGNMHNFELYIFNRWGEEIIKITQTNECWDGTYKSQSLSPDVYGYYIKHTRCDGEELEFRGNVSLIK